MIGAGRMETFTSVSVRVLRGSSFGLLDQTNLADRLTLRFSRPQILALCETRIWLKALRKH
jgi:hypothetical protein